MLKFRTIRALLVGSAALICFGGAFAKVLPETKVYAQAQFYPLHELNKGYLGRFVDLPLFLDPTTPTASPFKTDTPQYDLAVFLKQIEEYGIDGFTYFPSWGRVALGGFEALAKDSPRHMTHPPQIMFWYLKDQDVKAFEKALKDPFRLEVNGKTVIFLYNAQMKYSPEQLKALLDEMRAKWGDKFVTCGDFHSVAAEYRKTFAELGRIAPPLEAAFKERMRRYLRVLDGIYFGGGCMLFRVEKRERVFDDAYYRESLKLAKEVINEGEFRGQKLFGCTAEMAHENPTASNVWLCRDGTRTLRHSFETALAADVDFIILPEWDEWNENTCFSPSLYNSFAPMRIVRYYMQKLRQRPLEPRAGDDVQVPNLITTYRKHLAPGELFYIETILVPDGSEKGVVAIAAEVRNEKGEVLATLPEKMLDVQGAHGIAEARWELRSEELATRARALDVRLTWRKADGAKGVWNGLVVVDIAPANTWDHKEVSNCLRDRAHVTCGEVSFDHGRLCAKLACEEPIRYALAMANGRITRIPNAADSENCFVDDATNAAYALFIQGPVKDAQGRVMRVMARVRGVKDAAWVVPQRAVKRGESYRFEYFPWPSELYLRIPAAALAQDPHVEVADADGIKATLSLRTIREKGAFVVNETNGFYVAASRLNRQGVLPAVLNARETAFSVEMPCDARESNLYYVMLVTRGGKMWCSQAFVREAVAEKVPFRCYSAMDDCLKTIMLPRARVPRVDYDFSPVCGDAVRDKFARNRDFWGMRGKAYHPITLFARGHTMDGPFKIEQRKMKEGSPLPTRIHEADGSWSFAFDGVNDNVQFPLETIPLQSGYTLSFEFWPAYTNRPQTLCAARVSSSAGSLRKLAIEEGFLMIDYATSAELYPHEKKLVWKKILPVKEGAWNHLILTSEGDRFVVMLNGACAAHAIVPPGDHAASFALGGFPGEGFFKGKIRHVKVDHACNMQK